MAVQELIQEYRQSIEHQNRLLPITVKHTVVKNGIPDILFHWHPEMEIILVREGTANIHIDYDRFESEKDDIILIRPNGLHSIHPIDTQTHVTDSLMVHLDFLGASQMDQASIHLLQPLQNATSKFVLRIQPTDPGYDDLRSTLESILKVEHEKSDFYELELKSLLGHFIYTTYKHNYVRQKMTDDFYRKNEKIRAIIEYIHRNYYRTLTIAELAEEANYSETHFMTFFKSQTGTSAMDFIIQHRLHLATQELKHSVKPVLRIAEEVGFNNLSNFNRQFRKYYHQTPSQYRKSKQVKKT
ncbi:helix-turn-helix transcriptional regulator [Streptococcus moroccensis]|uniref:AraC-like DNA-binding protein n=1 Tax=Streptococcus moroccensis TaxID=1451356 RepID=A0ABT9YRV8_9STRE|nr:AraC family transcriptional regulator [Streptococcus moroccensis]MDQ0222730.1 AraC-like DNA-binding protein [Streptococcus moroccensis]